MFVTPPLHEASIAKKQSWHQRRVQAAVIQYVYWE